MKKETTIYSIFILDSNKNTYYIQSEKFECGSQEAWDEAYKMFELIKYLPNNATFFNLENGKKWDFEKAYLLFLKSFLENFKDYSQNIIRK